MVGGGGEAKRERFASPPPTKVHQDKVNVRRRKVREGGEELGSLRLLHELFLTNIYRNYLETASHQEGGEARAPLFAHFLIWLFHKIIPM